jgi:hypothetical protein
MYKMDFIEEYDNINVDLQDQIKACLLTDKREFSDSMVYQADTKEKLIKKDSRTSEFKTFKDKKIFELCEQLIDQINQKNKFHDYLLFKNDVTFIKYYEGGFFKKHEDYLSLVSNSVEEYTLIMSLNEANDICVGGNTILYPNKNFKYSSNASVLSNNILIFRKDIKHEGELITKGIKKIMTLNLWKVNKNKKIVVINFKDNKTHIIQLNNLLSKNANNKLKKYISELIASHDNLSNIIYFNEDEFTYEEFNIIIRIYSNCTINYEEYELYKNIITKYGFGWNSLIVIDPPPTIIVDKVNEEFEKQIFDEEDEESTEEEVEEATDYLVRECGTIQCPVIEINHKQKSYNYGSAYDTYSKKVNDIEKKIIMAETSFTNGVHIFNTEARYVQFIDIIKRYKLNYMPFKFLFAEGSVSYSGDYAYGIGTDNVGDSIDLDMTPLWSSFSERENIYHFNNVVHLGLHYTFNDLDDILSKPLVIPKTSDKFNKLENCGSSMVFANDGPSVHIIAQSEKPDDEYEDYCDLRGVECANVNLMCALDNNSLKNKLSIIFDDARNIDMTLGKCGTLDLDEDCVRYRGDYYSISQKNIMTLEPEHFDKLRKKIIEINPFKEALDKINTTKFTFPQISGSAEKQFCNEAVYGSLSVLQVCGVMKMD